MERIRMLISIITICRNNLQGLKLTIESVKRQKGCPEYEHIVIDGDSSDGTKEYLNLLKDEKIISISEPDKGISDAFNKGISVSHGEYLLFLNTGTVLYRMKFWHMFKKK